MPSQARAPLVACGLHRDDVLRNLLHDLVGGEGDELVPIAREELGLELDPVQPQRVEERRKGLHHAQHGDGRRAPDGVAAEDERKVPHLDRAEQHLLVENGGELRVRQRKRPQTQVGRGVGDAAEDVLDAVDGVGDDDLVHRKVLVVKVVVVVVRARERLATLVAVVGELGAERLALHALLVLQVEDDRLRDEQGDDREDHHHEEELLEAFLPRVQLLLGLEARRAEHHVDQHVDEVRLVGQVARHPLVEDEEDHVAEKAHHEDELRDKLQHDPHELLLRAQEVEQPEDDAERHLDDADDHGELHLHGVLVRQLVLRLSPRRVDAERVRRVRVLRVGVLLAVQRVLGAEDVDREAEEVVVQEAREDAKDRHDQHEVPPLEQHHEDVVDALRRLDLLFKVDHREGREEDERRVPGVAKHDGEQEGEGDDGEHAGVDFAVARDAVRVDDHLELPRELGEREVRRALFLGLDDLHQRRDLRARAALCGRECFEHPVDEARRAPALRDETLAPDVVVAHVHDGVDRLVLAHRHEEALDVAGILGEEVAPRLARVVEHALHLADAGVDVLERLHPLLRERRARVDARAEGVADALDAQRGLLALVEHDEHELLGELARGRVDDLLFDVGGAHEQVAAQRAPEHTLERRELVLRDDAGQEAESECSVGRWVGLVEQQRDVI